MDEPPAASSYLERRASEDKYLADMLQELSIDLLMMTLQLQSAVRLLADTVPGLDPEIREGVRERTDAVSDRIDSIMRGFDKLRKPDG